MLQTIKDYLTIIFNPMFWIRNYRTSKIWDEIFNELMEKHNFEYRTKHSARLGPILIWVSNHPYASFSPYNQDVLPRRITTIRAERKLTRDLLMAHLKREEDDAK